MALNDAQREAVETANAHLGNTGLPTYDEMLAAFQTIASIAGPQFGNDDGPGTVNRMARVARTTTAKARGEA